MNSNPETVSTDYDTCDRLYLEPVTLERVLDVVELERPLGVVVSLGGQTPLGLAAALEEAGVPLLGDPLPAIDGGRGSRAGSRRSSTASAFARPAWGHAETTGGARAIADEIGYPVLVRPSYVLGGSGMLVARKPAELVLDGPALDRPLPRRRDRARRRHPLRRRVRLGGVRARARRARGCPLRRLGLRRARALGHGPRSRARSARSRPRSRRRSAPAACSTSSSRCTTASCTCSRRTRAPRARSPSSSKATGIPLVDHACRLLLGASLGELGLPERVVPDARVGEGGDLPRRALRRRRRPGRRDALDRRGDGERPDARDRLPPRAPGGRPRGPAARDRRAALAS